MTDFEKIFEILKHLPPDASGSRAEWTDGEQSRPLRLNRPCECGCDQRDGYKGVGYLTCSDENGDGLTVWILTEQAFVLASNWLLQLQEASS